MIGERNTLVGQVNELTGERNELTRERNELTGERNELTGERNELTGERNELTGERNELTGERNELTGERNELTGERNELTGERNELTGERNELTGERNELTGLVNALSNQVNALTGERNELTGLVNALTNQVNTLTGERNRLTGLVNELTGSCNALGSQIEALTNRNNALTAQISSLAKMEHDPAGLQARRTGITPRLKPHARLGAERQLRKAKFLIISNMRSGSTWLQTMLGALPDVATDYELKWGATYQASAAHYILNDSSPTVSEILERMDSDAPITGTKFTFDPIELTRLDFLSFHEKIGCDVRIIHLTRRFRDMFLSRRRGFYHQLDESGSTDVGRHIKAAVIDADVGKAAALSEPTSVSPVSCYEELKVYLQHDAWITLLREAGLPYLQVDYDNIADELPEITSFVGSTTPPERVNSVIAHPPVIKLPAIDGSRLIENLVELEPLFAHFEVLRELLLTPGRRIPFSQNRP